MNLKIIEEVYNTLYKKHNEFNYNISNAQCEHTNFIRVMINLYVCVHVN